MTMSLSSLSLSSLIIIRGTIQAKAVNNPATIIAELTTSINYQILAL